MNDTISEEIDDENRPYRPTSSTESEIPKMRRPFLCMLCGDSRWVAKKNRERQSISIEADYIGRDRSFAMDLNREETVLLTCEYWTA